jgi:hypothetical protein
MSSSLGLLQHTTRFTDVDGAKKALNERATMVRHVRQSSTFAYRFSSSELRTTPSAFAVEATADAFGSSPPYGLSTAIVPSSQITVTMPKAPGPKIESRCGSVPRRTCRHYQFGRWIIASIVRRRQERPVFRRCGGNVRGGRRLRPIEMLVSLQEQAEVYDAPSMHTLL